MRPDLTALADQAEAAGSHAAAVLHAIARDHGSEAEYRKHGPVVMTLITRMQSLGTTGKLTLCPHLSWTAPSPACWCAWAPGRLRCAPCAAATGRRIKGTAEDRRCDHCRKIVPGIYPDCVQLPPVVVDLPPWPPHCVPPILMTFGLCPDCQQAEKENR